MAAQAIGGDQSLLVLGERRGNARSMSFNMHMLSPILLGFATPMLVIGVIDPAGLRHGRTILIAILLSLLLLAALLFAASLLWPGETTSIVFDRKARKVTFVQSGVLADSSVDVPFDEIAKIGVASRFDRDGYPFTQAELQLRDGERVALPEGTSPEMIAAAKEMLGL